MIVKLLLMLQGKKGTLMLSVQLDLIAEWHLFQNLIRAEFERVGLLVVRILDPEEENLFYVPFFFAFEFDCEKGPLIQSLTRLG